MNNVILFIVFIFIADAYSSWQCNDITPIGRWTPAPPATDAPFTGCCISSSASGFDPVKECKVYGGNWQYVDSSHNAYTCCPKDFFDCYGMGEHWGYGIEHHLPVNDYSHPDVNYINCCYSASAPGFDPVKECARYDAVWVQYPEYNNRPFECCQYTQSLDEICPNNMFDAINAGKVTKPWFHHIATSREFDASYPSRDAVGTAAYQDLSTQLAKKLGHKTNNIRSIYQNIDPTAALSDIGQCSNNNPTDCDTACWRKVVEQTEYELTLLQQLSAVQTQLTKFIASTKVSWNFKINEVANLLYIEKEVQSVTFVVPPSKSPSSPWDIFGAVLETIAGAILLPVAGPEISLFSWGIAATAGIGSSLLDYTSSGPAGTRVHISFVINYNNPVYRTTALYLQDIEDYLDQERDTVHDDTSLIAADYGKLQAVSGCYTRMNEQIDAATCSGAPGLKCDWDIIIDAGLAQLNYSLALTTWQVMTPSKYQYYIEFKCRPEENQCGKNCPGGHCQCGHGACGDGSGCDCGLIQPPCEQVKAPQHARSTVPYSPKKYMTAYTGNVWLADKKDSTQPIDGSLVKYLNESLSGAIGSNTPYSMDYIHNNLHFATSDDGAYVQVNLTGTISFSFKLNFAESACLTSCQEETASGWECEHNGCDYQFRCNAITEDEVLEAAEEYNLCELQAGLCLDGEV